MQSVVIFIKTVTPLNLPPTGGEKLNDFSYKIVNLSKRKKKFSKFHFIIIVIWRDNCIQICFKSSIHEKKVTPTFVFVKQFCF